jgi:hypothetical protein
LEEDWSFLATDEYVVARILVHINLRECLAEDIELVLRGKTFKQKLDYVGVPFRCRRCHKKGHVVRQCRLPFIPKGKNQVKDGPPSEKMSLTSKGAQTCLALGIVREMSRSHKRPNKEKDYKSSMDDQGGSGALV